MTDPPTPQAQVKVEEADTAAAAPEEDTDMTAPEASLDDFNDDVKEEEEVEEPAAAVKEETPAPEPPAASHPQPPQASPSMAAAPAPSSPSTSTRIPKKSQAASSTPSDSSALPPTHPGTNNTNAQAQNRGTSQSFDGPLILPDGVTLPATVTPEMLDGRLRRTFLDLSPQQMREVLAEFDDAVKEKGGEIRNHTAYLFGVVKRYKALHERVNVSGVNAMPQGTLSSTVIARLDSLVGSGFCTAGELDMKIKDRMKMLPERDALDAIDEMNGCSRAEIRNFGSYFMGIMNRYMRGERQNPQMRGANRAQNRMMGNNQGGGGHNRHDNNQNRNQYGNNGGNNDRFSHYGRNDGRDNSGKNDRRDGGRERRDRDQDRNRRSSRDDDRDKDRYRSSRRRRSRSRSSSYDSRSRSRSRSDSRERRHSRRRRRSRSRSGSRDRYSSRRDSSRRSSRGSSTKTYGQPQPAMGQMGVPPPPPPRAPNMMQPMPMGIPGQPPQQMMPQMPPGQQQFMQQLGGMPPQQMGQGANGQMQQLLMQQQMNQQNQASRMMMPGSHVPNPAAPIDILGLADKAAQALSGRMPQMNAMSNPNFPPPPASAPMTISQQQNNESQLPLMVGYAVQNLKTTGHIEKQLDPPLCAMLKRLPEHAALQALEIFSSCDLSKMRNKSAYLSGILRKELVKLGL